MKANIKFWSITGTAIITILALLVGSILFSMFFSGCAFLKTANPQFKTVSIPFFEPILDFKVPVDMPDFLKFENKSAIQISLNTVAFAWYTPETPPIGGRGTESFMILIDFYGENPQVVAFTHFKWITGEYKDPRNIDNHWIYRNGIPEPASWADLEKYITALGERDSESIFL